MIPRLLFCTTVFFFFACGSEPRITVTWEPQESQLTASLRGISAVNENLVWISGSGDKYARTLDGGRTYLPDSVPGAEELDFRDVQAFGADTAYLMSAGAGEKSRIYKTTDGGRSWQLQYTNTIEAAFFNSMAFRDADHGVVISDPVRGKMHMLFTEDGGASWQVLEAEKAPEFREGEYGFAASGTNVAVWGKRHIWVGSGGTVARVFRSRDGGRSWAIAETPMVHGLPSAGIFSIAFRDSLHGIAVGGDYSRPDSTAGNVIRTTDGGENWELIAHPETVGYRSCVTYVPQRDFTMPIAVGRSGCSYSTDDGRTWRDIPGEGYYAVSAAGGAIWAAGAGGRVVRARIAY